MPAADLTYVSNKVVDIINILPPDAFSDTCLHILTHLCGQSAGVDSAVLSNELSNAGVTLDHEDLQSIIRYVLLTFRFAGKHSLSADGLVSKLEEDSSRWAKPSLQVIHKLWSEHSAEVQLQQEAKGILSIGQLVDMQWKLGMAVSSDTCRSLNSPYVMVLLKVADPSGQIHQKSFEMTIQQFQNLHSHFKDIAAVMETV
ncbi:COMM domain-containing protein 6 [Eucyclogobius newberryi]|uniref:COMM domain-containing protein 6 n=1 Tax=Eucyclogobius newberryi TaxID=166745 RepID=UPI003B5ACBAC